MLQYFDMMYYHLATFYQRFSKKTSSWQLPAIFVIGMTQFMLLLDFWMIFTSLLKIDGKVNTYEIIVFSSLALFLIFYNMKKYEKKYQYYKSIWSVYTGNRKKSHIFLTFFTFFLAWGGVFILGFIFDKYK